METPKSLFIVLAEWWDQRQAYRRTISSERRAVSFTRLLPTPGNVIFTLAMIALLVLAQSAGALPLRLMGPNAPSTNTIAYQGRLANAGGDPLTGTYSIIFCLYAAASGGAPLWEEQWTGTNGVRVSDGLFNVMLGSLTSIPQAVVTGNSTLWLGITVGTDNEMAPRVQLGSVPFAVQALTVPDGSVTTAKIADQAVTQAKLGPDVNLVPPDGSITTAKLADGAVTTAKIANEASEPSRVESWFDDADYGVDGANGGATYIVDPNIVLVVPSGKAYYYLVTYHGLLMYNKQEQVGSFTSFHASWTATPYDDDTPLLQQSYIVQTGYRMDWNAAGGGLYWYAPYSTAWWVRLEEGTHNLRILVSGWSDNTMNRVHFKFQRVQVMRAY